MNDNDLPLDALFEIEGPDESGSVWIGSREGDPHVWAHNLGQYDKVVEKLTRFIAHVRDERKTTE